MTNRTFHHRFTLGALCGILLLACLIFWLLWTKAVAAALVLVAFEVALVERTLHSAYVFTNDSLLVRRGRFARERRIPLDSIVSCRPMTTTFGLVHYLLIGYGAQRHMLAVQPENEAEFVRCLQRLVGLRRVEE